MTDSVTSPHRMTMGLSRLSADESWLEIDDDLARDLEAKRALLRRHPHQVFVELACSAAGQRAVLDHLTRTLLTSHAEHFALRGTRLSILASGDSIELADASMPCLMRAALCVQEDLVLMQRVQDAWRLTAAAVCFPTRWDLPSQLGRTMSEIHAVVPGYAERLAGAADRFLEGMKPGIVFRRANWSLLDDPSLFQPRGPGPADPETAIEPADAGTKVWLRVEHQTLQRISATDGEEVGILFGIRVHRTRLDDVGRDADAARRLVGAIETMAPDLQRYKSLARVRGPALAYLEQRLA